ncbi:MAG: hypothetical protein KDJ80_08445 [Nitratireductor sp.]|nr:hypothetical protein [Nitratireductor sp.]
MLRSVEAISRPRSDFSKAAKSKKSRPSRKPVAKPFSIRLSEDERYLLEREAGKLSLSAHIRKKLLSDAVSPRRGGKLSRKQRRPDADRVAIGRMLAVLGQSELAANMQLLAKAASMGALPVTPEIVAALRTACADIRRIRDMLVSALGVRESR